jgi:GNAT superfamily N-acetyltransferase
MTTTWTADRPLDAVVRPADPEDSDALVDVLSAAFAADPVFAWWVPAPDRRRALLPAFFRVAVDGSLPYGEVYAARPGGGAQTPGTQLAAGAVWLPPDLEPDEAEAELLLARYADAAEEADDRLLALYALVGEVHPKEPHMYLFLLGVRPVHQGHGLGSALLRHVLKRCDRDGTPAYLEASTEANRRLYLRHGFVDRGAIRLPDGPQMWPMWRDPR